MSGLYTIYLVEDHPLMREGLAMVLENYKEFKVIGWSETLSQALQEIPKLKPQGVVVDLTLKDGDGLEVVQFLSKNYPKIAILVLSMHDEELYAERAIQAGALGYLMKEESSETFIQALKTVLAGEVYLSSRISKRLLFQMARGKQEDQEGVQQLSQREFEIFRLLGQGFKNKEIAEKLCLSPKTVETYRERIKIKLGFQCSAEVVRYAIQWWKDHEG
ncbi:MAG: DNA-binding response regulator [Planctomycetota bacterium]|nr:MAG: DNA-binding response regulator [Planctomycetota bacterium]